MAGPVGFGVLSTLGAARRMIALVEQPSGTVTFLFTDVEGSTRLLEDLGAERYREALAEHRRLLREAFARHGGYEVDHEGDAFFVAFRDARAGVAAAREAQAALAGGPIRVRAALHTGEPLLDPPKYVGIDVHLAARIMSAGHGGQVLLSHTTRELIEERVRDLGEHRLKDFAAPVWLFQLGDDSFPPLRTISNTNLPRPASSFVGREREVGEVVSLLRDGARLVTLTGPGGSGKTRLAIEAAAELIPEFRGGVFWVGLAALRDPSLVLETIERTLGARDELALHVGERELLLVLDNFEQVVEAAPELSRVLEACRNLHVIATSREHLRLRGEVRFPVLPLAEQEAVELYAARAGVEPDDTAIELCRRLDNLPLAIELAAGAATVLTTEQILTRLGERLDLLQGGRDADPRHATLRATTEWSYRLLAPPEKELFACLSVFAGGCTLEAAEQVAGADLRVLQGLVEKSLVRRTGDRFWILETIREFATERRGDLRDGDALERRHDDFFMALARAAEVGERGPDQSVWWDRLEAEVDNLRSALDRARRHDEAELELELATLLKRFWQARGHIREGKTRLEDALARAPEAGGLLRARALSALGFCTLYAGGDPEALMELSREALRLYTAAGDAAGVARTTNDLGIDMIVKGDFDAAQKLFERARVLASEVGDLRYTSFAAHNLADLALIEGNYRLAVERGRESLAAGRESGDPGFEQLTAIGLGWALAGVGELSEARSLGLGALRETVVSGDDWLAQEALELLALLDVELGAAERAALLAGLADRFREELGLPRAPGEERLYRPAMEKLEALLGTKGFHQGRSRGAALNLEEAVALAKQPSATEIA